MGFGDPGEMKQLGLYHGVLSEVVLLLCFILLSLYYVWFCWVLPQHLCILIHSRYLIARQRIFCLFVKAWCSKVISDSENYQKFVVLSLVFCYDFATSDCKSKK